ncbi:MAG: hypothetical protein RLZZ306_570 [Bacteroidota bacterium]|jgi:hypothetical protein
MDKKILNQEALSIVELEERFETTVAALDTARCSGNTVDVPTTTPAPAPAEIV